MEMIGHDRLAFSLAEYRRRYDQVKWGMRDLGVDAFLVRTPENIYYLTGYENPATFAFHCLLLSEDEPVIILRRLEEPNVREFSWLTRTVTIEDHEHPIEIVSQTLDKMGLGNKRIGVERGLGKSGFYFWVDEYELLQSRFPKATLVNATAVLDRTRLVKSPEEIGVIREAARITDAGAQTGIDAVQAGRTEDELAAEIYRALILHGSQYPSLPPFVLSGERTSLPHGTWRGRRLQARDHVYFEIPGTRHRYTAAIMRCVSVGEPEPRVRAMADAVIAGLEAAMAAIRPGTTSGAVDAACRSAIQKAGFGQYFNHRTGYSIGVSFPPGWGEGHILSLRRDDPTPLQANMTFHLVPLCLVYREVGVGFSATVRVTEHGCEELTSLPRQLIVK
jgi:Xaa-Pro dipeptidase